jgi:hypothetical protein
MTTVFLDKFGTGDLTTGRPLKNLSSGVPDIHEKENKKILISNQKQIGLCM